MSLHDIVMFADRMLKCLFTLWYSCCRVMYIIWSMRWLRLSSRVAMLSLVFAVLGSIECSPIWMSKCSFCKSLWRKMNGFSGKSIIFLYVIYRLDCEIYCCNTAVLKALPHFPLYSVKIIFVSVLPAFLRQKRRTLWSSFGSKSSADQRHELWR